MKPLTDNSIIRCSRCSTKTKFKKATDWNIVYDKGLVAGFLCGRCITDQEYAEAEINAATLNYSTATVDRDGRARVKAVDS